MIGLKVLWAILHFCIFVRRPIIRPQLWAIFFVFRNCLAQTLTLTLDLGHRVRTKWDEGGNKPKSGNKPKKPKFRFLGYNYGGR